MSNPIVQFITPPPPCCFPALVSIHLFSTSVSQFLPCKLVHLYHFSSFHIYALISDISFSLSDLLHSVWQSLYPSTSQQMTQFRSFLWLSNIPFFFFWILFYFFIQQVLISHPFYAHPCVHVNPNLPIHHTTTPPPAAFPPWCPYICSLHLCLNFCPAKWFICTIFLGSTYMR